MSIASLSQLSTEEVNLVLNTPALVSLLIGGADNNFDNEEKERAKKIVAFRKTTGDPLLFEYFCIFLFFYLTWAFNYLL